MTETDQSIQPLEGKTTVDNATQLDTQRLVYQSAKYVANEIAGSIGDKIPNGITRLVIADSKFLADSASVKAAYFCLDNLIKEYETLATAGRALTKQRQPDLPEDDIVSNPPHESFMGDAIGLAGLAIPSIASPALLAVNTALEVLGFFRQDVEYHGVTATIDGLAYEIALADCLSKKIKMEILVPALRMFPAIQTGQDSLQNRLAVLEANKAMVWGELYPLINELAQMEADLDFAVSKKNDNEIDRLRAKIMETRGILQPLSDSLSLVDQRYANLMKEWEGTDGNATPKIARMLTAESINSGKTIFLHTDVVVSGGYYRTHRSLLRTMFTGDGLTFVGGVVVRWALINLDGKFFGGGIIESKHKESGWSS